MTYHIFNTSIATDFDMCTAVFLENIKFWCFKNLTNRKHIHDNNVWTYNSMQAFSEIFPYWTTQNLRTVINNCLKNNLIVKGNYNSNTYDRTVWYALTSTSIEYFADFKSKLHEVINVKNINTRDDDLKSKQNNNNTEKALQPAVSPICWNQQMDLLESTNGFVESNKCSYRTDINTNTNTLNEKKGAVALSSAVCVVSDVESSKTKTQNPVNSESAIPMHPRFGLEQMKSQNPHNLPTQMLSDWLEVRRERKVTLTATAWHRVNINLGEIQANCDISAINAFEQAVCAGWLSVEPRYFTKREKSKKEGLSFADMCAMSSVGLFDEAEYLQ